MVFVKILNRIRGELKISQKAIALTYAAGCAW